MLKKAKCLILSLSISLIIANPPLMATTSTNTVTRPTLVNKITHIVNAPGSQDGTVHFAISKTQDITDALNYLNQHSSITSTYDITFDIKPIWLIKQRSERENISTTDLPSAPQRSRKLILRIADTSANVKDSQTLILLWQKLNSLGWEAQLNTRLSPSAIENFLATKKTNPLAKPS